MDFFDDLIQGVQRTLTASGVGFDAKRAQTDPIVFLATYLEFEARKIDDAPRRVHVSKELQASPERTAHCVALDRLAELARTGQSLQPYQSKQIHSFERNDLLLADWNIHHLHLGEQLRGQAFATRTGPLLFATFLPDDAYFVAVMDHSSFSEIELLEIIDANWPRYLDEFTLKGVIGVSHAPTSADVSKLRRAGIQTVIPLASGRVLTPPGGGLTTARSSIAHMMRAQAIHRLLENAEEYVRQNETDVRAALKIGSAEVVRLASLEPDRIVFTADGSPLQHSVPIAG